MEQAPENQNKLETFLERFIDNGFLDFFPNAKADLLNQFVQSLGRMYHLDGLKTKEKPGEVVLRDFLKILDLLTDEENMTYIPDFFIAISHVPRTESEQLTQVVSPAERLAAAFAILQLDDLLDNQVFQEICAPMKRVGQSIFVIRNNLVVSYALPSLAKQSETQELALKMKIRVQSPIHDLEEMPRKNHEQLASYLESNLSVHIGEAELHVLASDRLRVEDRMHAHFSV